MQYCAELLFSTGSSSTVAEANLPCKGKDADFPCRKTMTCASTEKDVDKQLSGLVYILNQIHILLQLD